MALTTRVLTNTGQPLYHPDGTLVADGTEITFTLTGEDGKPGVYRFDATSGEMVLASVSTTTTSGVFSISLWTTDRASETAYIRMAIPSVDVPDIVAYIPTGSGSLLLSEFAALANSLVATPWTYNVTGTAAPTVTPSFVGQRFIDTANKVAYTAFGVASSADWIVG